MIKLLYLVVKNRLADQWGRIAIMEPDPITKCVINESS